jgi:hypothetical protein
MGASQAKMLATARTMADGSPDVGPVVVGDDAAADVPDVPARELVQKKLGGRLHSWDQYGACGRDNVLTNRYDVCDAWMPREEE